MLLNSGLFIKTASYKMGKESGHTKSLKETKKAHSTSYNLKCKKTPKIKVKCEKYVRKYHLYLCEYDNFSL